MDNTEIQERVKKVISRVLRIEPAMIEPGSHFVFDLGAESTQSVELVAAFEGEFDIEMDDEAALKVQTVGDAVAFIAKYVETAAGAGSPGT
jgi:acyl carrier protein